MKKFDPEIGDIENYCTTLEEWAKIILENLNNETGYSLARDWQAKNGSLSLGKRLLPKVPLVLGSDYEIDNLYAADSLEGMMFRADICKQIRDLADGTQVRLSVIK